MKKTLFIFMALTAGMFFTGCTKPALIQNDANCVKALTGNWKNETKFVNSVMFKMDDSEEQVNIGTAEYRIINELKFNDNQTYSMAMKQIYDGFTASEEYEISEENLAEIENMFKTQIFIRGTFEADKDYFLISGRSVTDLDGTEVPYEDFYADHKEIGPKEVLAKYRLEAGKLIINGNDTTEIVYSIVE